MKTFDCILEIGYISVNVNEGCEAEAFAIAKAYSIAKGYDPSKIELKRVFQHNFAPLQSRRYRTKEQDRIIARLLEIEKEMMQTEEPPRLRYSDCEDVSDNYQAHLEYREWYDCLNEEYESLQRKLYKTRTPRSLRDYKRKQREIEREVAYMKRNHINGF